MGKSIPSNRLVVVLLVALGVIFVIAFVMLVAFGTSYREKSGSDSLAAAQKLQLEKYDLRRLKLERDGQTIEVFQNGTLIKTDRKGKRQAVLGYSKIRDLLSSLTEDQLKNLSSSGGSGNTITIETGSGAIYVIDIGDDNGILDDLIDDLEDTADDTLNPSPIPTPAPTPPPDGGPTPTPTPFTSPEPSGGGPTPPPTGGPTPPPSGLPAYMTALPFDCGDYSLIKQTIISDIVCDPNP